MIEQIDIALLGVEQIAAAEFINEVEQTAPLARRQKQSRADDLGNLGQSLPHIPRTEIVWRSHFLLGALYYALVTPGRVSRLSRGGADGADAGHAIEQLVRSTVASFQAPPLDLPMPSRSAAPNKT